MGAERTGRHGATHQSRGERRKDAHTKVQNISMKDRIHEEMYPD